MRAQAARSCTAGGSAVAAHSDCDHASLAARTAGPGGRDRQAASCAARTAVRTIRRAGRRSAAIPAEPQCHEGSARSRPGPRVRLRVPERPEAVAGRGGAETGERRRGRPPGSRPGRGPRGRGRRAPSRSRPRRCRARHGPATSRRRELGPAPSERCDGPEPDPAPAGDVAVARGRRWRREASEVDPGDARGPELEARRLAASPSADRPVQPAGRSATAWSFTQRSSPRAVARSAGSRSRA